MNRISWDGCGPKWIEALQPVDVDLDSPSEMRKVSLRRLQAAIETHLRDGTELPDAVKFLGGLTRLEYVFVYPETQDIVLAGPAEGWELDALGNVVGSHSGKPVMMLDDLLVALRMAPDAAQQTISCSIDPTPEGMQRLQTYFAGLRSMGRDTRRVMRSVEERLGPHRITLTTVPPESRFAQALVAADYRMKRLAMNLEKSPLRELPSFMHLVGSKSRPPQNMMPRWWLAPAYEPLLKDGDGLAWQFQGASVQVMTEQDYVTAGGKRRGSGQVDATAKRWADLMTENYESLSAEMPIFAELQNLMDLAIAATLIHKENLADTAGLDLTLLATWNESLQTARYAAPATVAAQASFVKQRRNYVVSASGGVEMNTWAIASDAEVSPRPAAARSAAASAEAETWWWN